MKNMENCGFDEMDTLAHLWNGVVYAKTEAEWIKGSKLIK